MKDYLIYGSVYLFMVCVLMFVILPWFGIHP